MDSMDTLREAVNAAYENYRKALGKLVVKTLTELSASDPQATFEYIAGMGQWSFMRNGIIEEDGETYEREDEIEPEPAFSAVMDAYSDYGDSVVPDGTFRIKGKKVLANSLG